MKAIKVIRLIAQALLASWLLAMAMIGAQKGLYTGMLLFAIGGVVLAIITAIEGMKLVSHSGSN